MLSRRNLLISGMSTGLAGGAALIGLFLAVLSMIDSAGSTKPAAPATTCSFTVNADAVNVRTGATAASPSVQKLERGQTVVATKTVDNGFRQMADGTWVLDDLLTPVPGSACRRLMPRTRVASCSRDREAMPSI
jgi:uncharacterized protein YgiM (DUF1202 family)